MAWWTGGIEGNHYFRREDLREQMLMQPAGGLLVYRLIKPIDPACATYAVD